MLLDCRQEVEEQSVHRCLFCQINTRSFLQSKLPNLFMLVSECVKFATCLCLVSNGMDILYSHIIETDRLNRNGK